VVLLSVVLLWEMAACGGATSAVLTDDGDLFTFGRGGDGKLGVGDTRGR
jgi:alpha-tubulin suppressor-like RCC1 family protein